VGRADGGRGTLREKSARLKGGRYEGKGSNGLLEKRGGGDAESFAEVFDVMFVELPFAALAPRR